MKSIINPKLIKELKGIKKHAIKYFAFYYNNKCPVYKKAKYNASYWLQESELKQLRGIKEVDRLQELNKDPITTFSPETAKKLMM